MATQQILQKTNQTRPTLVPDPLKLGKKKPSKTHWKPGTNLFFSPERSKRRPERIPKWSAIVKPTHMFPFFYYFFIYFFLKFFFAYWWRILRRCRHRMEMECVRRVRWNFWRCLLTRTEKFVIYSTLRWFIRPLYFPFPFFFFFFGDFLFRWWPPDRSSLA